jgi:hypothetical protein
MLEMDKLKKKTDLPKEVWKNIHIPKSIHDDLWKPSDYTWSIE